MTAFEISEVAEKQHKEWRDRQIKKIEEIQTLVGIANNMSGSISSQLIRVFGSLDAANTKSKEKINKIRLQNEEHQRNIGKIHFARKKLEVLKKLSDAIVNLEMWLGRINKMYNTALDRLEFTLQKKWLKEAGDLNSEAEEYINW